MIDTIKRVERRKEAEDGAEASRLELTACNEVHRSRGGGGRVRRDANEAQHDVHREPNGARTLWLQERAHAGKVGRHRHQSGDRRSHQRQTDFARQALDHDQGDGEHQTGEGKSGSEAGE